MFTIAFEPVDQLFVITFGGMLSDDEARSYVEAIKTAYVRHVGARLHYSMLIDVTAAAIQPQSVMHILAEHITAFPKADALAVITGKSLMKMQVQRVLGRDYLGFFGQQAEARPWLRQQGGITRASRRSSFPAKRE